jgi:hypothetical protein
MALLDKSFNLFLNRYYELHQCRTLIAYRLEDSGYRLVKTITITGESIAEQPRVRIPPFDDVEMDLAFIVGE